MSKTEVLALIVALVVLLSHIAAPKRIEAILVKATPLSPIRWSEKILARLKHDRGQWFCS